MTALTFATTRVQLCKEQVAMINRQEASPTTPGTASSCIYPQVRKDPRQRVYRQLHRDQQGQKYYTIANGDRVPVAENDPRILSTASVRQLGYDILDGGVARRHHRDV